MEDIILEIMVAAIIVICSIIQESFDKRKRKEQNSFYDNPEYQKLVLKNITKKDDSDLKTAADIAYSKKARKAKQMKQERKGKTAIACPNCGAPLVTIYTRCAYCGMSYKEASDEQKESNLDGGELN